MKEALSEIIQLATVDSEPWVLMVADILKSFPETGSLNLDLEEQNPNVQDILGELREKGTLLFVSNNNKKNWNSGLYELQSSAHKCFERCVFPVLHCAFR